MGQTSTPRKKIWVGAPQWRKIRAAIRKEAIGYVTKGVFAALMAALLFSLHRVETVLLPLVQGFQLNASLTSFDSSAHSVAVAEIQFLRAVQKVDCNSQFFDKDYQYLMNGHYFDLGETCTPTILKSQDNFMLGALIDSITLYSDTLAAIADQGRYQGPDPDSRKLAMSLPSLTKSEAPGLDSNTKINIALSMISSFVLYSKFTSPEAAATAIRPALSAIIELLTHENFDLAQAASNRSADAQYRLQTVLAQLRSQQKTMSFFDVLEARRIVQDLNSFGPIQQSDPMRQSETQGDFSSDLNPTNYAAHLNAALYAIIQANNAIASAPPGAIDAALARLTEVAQEAQSASPSSQQ